VTQRGVGVICYKVVNGRYMEKRVNVRVEHVKHSKCRQEFLDRVKSNAAKKREAKEKGEHINLKRQPVQPREARTISIKNNAPQTLTALPCELRGQTGGIASGAPLTSRRDHYLRGSGSSGIVRCVWMAFPDVTGVNEDGICSRGLAIRYTLAAED